MEYTKSDCKVDTINHIHEVRKMMIKIAKELLDRAQDHDATKLVAPELEVFTENTPKLKSSTYGSEEYNNFLKDMRVALDHHYARNRHHPEHFKNGINDMTLIDLIEMLCDWYSAARRHNDGNIRKSIELNKSRFNIDTQLTGILTNTVVENFK